MLKLLGVFTLGAMMIFMSCTDGTSMDDEFVGLANAYIERYLELNPEAATELGDHRYDDRLDDYGIAGIKRRLEFNKSALKDLKKIDPGRLAPVNRIDYHILRNRVEFTIFRLEVLREHEWNPLAYNVGGGIYSLIAREFGTVESRMQSVKGRLEMVPEVAALAKANLEHPPKIHTETAILQNRGTISLIRDQLPEAFPDSVVFARELRPAQEKAIAALEYYGAWLEKDLLPISNGDFRIGEEKYRRKLRYVLDSELSMGAILERAREDLAATQGAMFETARVLHEKYFPGVAIADDRKHVIKTVLDRLADSHPTNETIVTVASESLEESVAFVRSQRLVTLPDEPLELIVMPEFRRGVAVAYCDAPGPLEPAAKTFFAISPTPVDWTEQRTESFFREYNKHMIHDLTIHEAVPGHYLQLAHSHRFDAPTMIRSIFSSGPFIEGWATYAEQFMAEQGYGGPEVKIQQQKMRLRMIINAMIDQGIHAGGMTEQQAMDLMLDEGFQEEGEASGKWRRACMTSTQLSTYYVGNIEVVDIRRDYEQKHPGSSLLEIHDKMLSFGSPPPRFVRESMGL